MHKRLIASGCSQTYGHGLEDISLPNTKGKVDYSKGPSKQAWPELLKQKGNYDEVINLSMPASSNKRIAHIITTVQDLNPNDTVVFCWTFLLRNCVLTPSGEYKYLHAHKEKRSNDYKLSTKWVEFRALAEQEDYDLIHENLVWMQFANNFARKKTKRVYNFSVMGGIDQELLDLYDLNLLEDFQKTIRNFPPALDNSHAGPQAHDKIAEIINNYIED